MWHYAPYFKILCTWKNDRVLSKFPFFVNCNLSCCGTFSDKKYFFFVILSAFFHNNLQHLSIKLSWYFESRFALSCWLKNAKAKKTGTVFVRIILLAFSKNVLYWKMSNAIESMASINVVIFYSLASLWCGYNRFSGLQCQFEA